MNPPIRTYALRTASDCPFGMTDPRLCLAGPSISPPLAVPATPPFRMTGKAGTVAFRWTVHPLPDCPIRDGNVHWGDCNGGVARTQEPRRDPRWLRSMIGNPASFRLLGFVVAVLLAVPALALAAPSPAYQLAVIDGHGAPSGRTVRTYSRALDRLRRDCTNSRRKLADDSVTAQQLLRRANIDRSNLRILRAVYNRVAGTRRHNCTRDFAAYVTATKRH